MSFQQIFRQLVLRLLHGVLSRVLHHLFFFFQSFQSLQNVRVHKISNVLSVHDLRNIIILPLRVGQQKMFLQREIEHTSSSHLFLHLFQGRTFQLLVLKHGLRHHLGSILIVSFLALKKLP